MVTMSVPLDENLARQIEELAKRIGKTVQEVLADAAREHVGYTQQLAWDVEEGQREVREGRFFTSDEVRAELSRRRDEQRR